MKSNIQRIRDSVWKLSPIKAKRKGKGKLIKIIPIIRNIPKKIEKLLEPSLNERLIDIRLRKEEQRTLRTNSKIEDGFLYLLTSPAYPGWTKVGQTSDYEKRLQTYQTASPFTDYEMITKKYVLNRIDAETKFIDLAKIVFEVKGEWINADVNELMKNF